MAVKISVLGLIPSSYPYPRSTMVWFSLKCTITWRKKTYFDQINSFLWKKLWKIEIFFEKLKKKIIKHLSEKSFSVFGGLTCESSKHTKKKFWQHVLLFFFFNSFEKYTFYHFKIFPLTIYWFVQNIFFFQIEEIKMKIWLTYLIKKNY